MGRRVRGTPRTTLDGTPTFRATDVAVLISLLALGCHVTTYVAPYWFRSDAGRFGLWGECASPGGCSWGLHPRGSVLPRVLLSCSLLLGTIGLTTAFVQSCCLNYKRHLLVTAGIIHLVASLFTLVGAAGWIYEYIFSTGENGEIFPYSLDWCVYLSIVGLVLSTAAGTLLLDISNKKSLCGCVYKTY